jgi:hypothetical protein
MGDMLPAGYGLISRVYYEGEDDARMRVHVDASGNVTREPVAELLKRNGGTCLGCSHELYGPLADTN